MTPDQYLQLLVPGFLTTLLDIPGHDIMCKVVNRDGALIIVGDNWEEELLPTGFDTDPEKVVLAWGAAAMRAKAKLIVEKYRVGGLEVFTI